MATSQVLRVSSAAPTHHCRVPTRQSPNPALEASVHPGLEAHAVVRGVLALGDPVGDRQHKTKQNQT